MKTCKISTTHVKTIFAKFGIIYGELWDRRIGNYGGPTYQLALQMWADQLIDITEDQVKQALRRIQHDKTEFTKYPPNLIEFWSLCNSISPRITAGPTLRIY